MKKEKWGKAGIIVLAAFMLSGCGGGPKTEETEAGLTLKDYPLTLLGKEIIVGETTVSVLLDAGFDVTWSEMTEGNQIENYTVDPEELLDADSYYSGGTITLGDVHYAHIGMVTEEEAVPMGDAVIANLEFLLTGKDVDRSAISLAGIPFSEMTREKAGEAFPDFTGDENMWFEYGKDYEVFFGFDTDGNISNFSLKQDYDVDWEGEQSS